MSDKQEILENIRQNVIKALPPGASTYTITDLCTLSRHEEPVIANCSEKPLVGLILQGTKILDYGINEFILNDGMMLVSCVDTPISSSIANVSPQYPFISIYFYLNRHIITDLSMHFPKSIPGSLPNSGSAWIEPANSFILDAFLRLSKIMTSPLQIEILGPLVLKELHFFVLATPQGARLREIYMRGGHDERIITIINWLKENLTKSISMSELARMAHMSVSSFHRHFKALTGYSPLQYQKKMRLFEAQHLMLINDTTAAEAAIQVGYESITQFNREYRRLFGEPPVRNIAQLRHKLEH